MSNDLSVIGTASLDLLHLANGQTAQAAGGAALYTALAACRVGAKAGLFAPKPDPMPVALQPVVRRLQWVGPSISLESLPRLEIEHHGQGQATLLQASWGAEPQLTPQTMPGVVTEAPLIHIAALSTAQRQLDFLRELRKQRPATGPELVIRAKGRRSLLSVGTYARLVYDDTDRVRRLFTLADLFFMNENEATGLFGTLEQARTRPGALLFVTLDAAGALVIEGDQVTHVPGHPATELDPTGAGDAFCGATLAGLARGQSPVAAAQQAVKLAAQTVQAVGPGALLEA